MEPLKPKKSLGQHFLRDGNIIRKITDAIPLENPSDLVLEIGPGTGTMTEVLLDRFKNVKAVEIDQRAVRFLNQKFPKLTVVHGNVLKISWDELLDHDGNIHIVGNLPYYITSQILFAILENRQHIQSAVLMMQKEVAARLVAVPRTKAYGILSVQVQLMSSPEILFDVSPHVFYPPPKVTSSVVGFHFDQPPLACSDKNLKTVVRTAFQQRRKKLSNSLKGLEPLPDDPEFDYDARAEAWSPRTYEKLTARLEQLGTLS
ncbi:MAG: 16S rRNA (adenine(1518)-N(6)/adenine(1519)-N(6))-dimethyltransferase RsmA [Balneolaceae bacterium]